VRIQRDLYSVRVEIQAFFDKHGKRPTVRQMGTINAYLQRKHGTTLKAMCESMGLPERPKRTKYDWTLDDAAQQIQTFYEEKGYRPTGADLTELDGWLRYHHGTSIRIIAEELEIPGRHKIREGIEDAINEVQSFYDEKEFRPTACDLPGLNYWLAQHHNSSVSRLCQELGMPGGRDYTRTMESVENKIRKFFAEHKRRPTKKDNRKDDVWLKKQGSSLSKLCDKMGMPPACP